MRSQNMNGEEALALLEAEQLPLDQQVGNYRLIRQIGRGEFADVYLGEHRYLKTPRVIKMGHGPFSEQVRQQFLGEAQVIASLKHPNIVRLYDYGLEEARPYLVMSYAPNGSVRQLAPRGTRLAPQQFLPLVEQIAAALEFAHHAQVIHRDVKPENILLGPQGQVLISDFGLAFVVRPAQLPPEQTMVGTAAYAAPEQLQGQPCYGSDQYSLGIVIYEWLCGACPFTGTFAEVAGQQVLAPPPSLCQKVEGLSPAVEQVLFKSLAKEPTQRYETITAFACALRAAYQQTKVISRAMKTKRGQAITRQDSVLPSDQAMRQDSNHLDPHASARRTISPLPPGPSQPGSRPSRVLRYMMFITMALALLIGSTVWYGQEFFGGRGWQQKPFPSSTTSQSTATATPMGSPQATAKTVVTGAANGATPTATAGAPSNAGSTPPPTETTLQTPPVGQDCLMGSSSQLTFTPGPGKGNPASLMMTLTNCGGSIQTWTVSVVTMSGGDWLSVNPSTGMIAVDTSSHVQVKVMSTHLSAGMFTGLITFRKGTATWILKVTCTILQP